MNATTDKRYYEEAAREEAKFRRNEKIAKNLGVVKDVVPVILGGFVTIAVFIGVAVLATAMIGGFFGAMSEMSTPVTEGPMMMMGAIFLVLVGILATLLWKTKKSV